MNAANQRLNAIDRLADLVAKSLVAADVGGTEPLLDTTRAHVIEKFDESGERERIAPAAPTPIVGCATTARFSAHGMPTELGGIKPGGASLR